MFLSSLDFSPDLAVASPYLYMWIVLADFRHCSCMNDITQLILVLPE